MDYSVMAAYSNWS